MRTTPIERDPFGRGGATPPALRARLRRSQGALAVRDDDVARLRRYQAVAAEAASLALGDDHEALADIAVHRLRAVLGLQCCAVFERRADTLVLWASAGGALEPEGDADGGCTTSGRDGTVVLDGRQGPRGLLTAVPRPGRVLGPDERFLLRAIADILSAALDGRHVESQLRHRAQHDQLTGLPNGPLLADRLEVAVAASRRLPGRVALLCVALDRFKRVNDARGQQAGDALLRAVAQRLVATVRPGDTVARLGGDVFAVLCVVDRPVRAHDLSERLLAELREPFPIGGDALVVTASIGVAVAGRGQEDGDRLLRDADLAMHRAKERGTDRIEEHAALQPALGPRPRDMETELRAAIGSDSLRLEYQPVMTCADGAVAGVEALVRWPSRDGVLRPPATFVPLAEATGLIVPLGEWVLRTACREALRWAPRGGGRAPELAVNLSARQLAEPDLVDRVAGILSDTGLPPGRLILEITETAFLRDRQSAIVRLRGLQGLGVAISIDDFGTGWSSLDSLRSLPVDGLKIDRTFVADVADGRDGRAFVSAILDLAANLGLSVVAEGVETDAQLQVLRSMGCAQVQGFLLARPGPPEELSGLLHRRPPVPPPARALVLGGR